MITADTITDEQIRELRAQREIGFLTFSLAVIGRGNGPEMHERARCAEILNARTTPVAPVQEREVQP